MKSKHLPSVLSALLIVLCVNVASAQPTRISAQSQYNYSTSASAFNFFDSTNYYYSGGLGGDLTHPIKFTTDTVWSDSSGTYYPTSISFQTFDGGWNIIQDSVVTWNRITSSWINSSLTQYTYDGSGNMLTATYQHWNFITSTWQNYSNNVYAYNAAGYERSVITQFWDTTASSWTNFIIDSFTLNSSNIITFQQVLIWNATFLKFNTYYQQYKYYYTPANVLDTVITQNYMGGTFGENALNSYTYDGSGNMLTDTAYRWSTKLSNWLLATLYNYTYNSNNQRTMSITQTWDSAGGAWYYSKNDKENFYYYETTPASVKSIASVSDFNLFPNPASGIFQMNIKWNQAEPFSVAICDMTGRIIRRWNEAATTNYTKTVPTGNLTPGTYFIMVTSREGQINKQLVITN